MDAWEPTVAYLRRLKFPRAEEAVLEWVKVIDGREEDVPSWLAGSCRPVRHPAPGFAMLPAFASGVAASIGVWAHVELPLFRRLTSEYPKWIAEPHHGTIRVRARGAKGATYQLVAEAYFLAHGQRAARASLRAQDDPYLWDLSRGNLVRTEVPESRESSPPSSPRGPALGRDAPLVATTPPALSKSGRGGRRSFWCRTEPARCAPVASVPPEAVAVPLKAATLVLDRAVFDQLEGALVKASAAPPALESSVGSGRSQLKVDFRGQTRNLACVAWEIMGGRPLAPGELLKSHATPLSAQPGVRDLRACGMFVGSHRGWPLWETVSGAMEPCEASELPPGPLADANNPGRAAAWAGAGRLGERAWIGGLHGAPGVASSPHGGMLAVECGDAGVVLVAGGRAWLLRRDRPALDLGGTVDRSGFLRADLPTPAEPWLASGRLAACGWRDDEPARCFFDLADGTRVVCDAADLSLAVESCEPAPPLEAPRAPASRQSFWCPWALDRVPRSEPDPGLVGDPQAERLALARPRARRHACTRMCDPSGAYGHAPDFRDAWEVARWIQMQRARSGRIFERSQREYLGLDGFFSLRRAQELWEGDRRREGTTLGARPASVAAPEPPAAQAAGEHRHTRLCRDGVCAPNFGSGLAVHAWLREQRRAGRRFTWWERESLDRFFDLRRAQDLCEEDRATGRTDPGGDRPVRRALPSPLLSRAPKGFMERYRRFQEAELALAAGDIGKYFTTQPRAL